MSGLSSVNFNRVSGLASGIDYETIINNLMKAERAPLDKLNQNKTVLEWKQQDYKSLAKDIYDFNQQVFSMKLSSAYKAKNVGVSNSNAVDVSAGGSAVSGAYTINVTQLAAPAYMTSADDLPSAYNEDGSVKTLKGQFADITADSGTFTISNGGNSKGISVDFNTDTIYTLASKITNAGIGVTASYDENTHRFFIMSNTTGSSNQIGYTDVSVDDGTTKLMGDLLHLSTSASGQDAKFEFNGTELTESTNKFTINNLNITLKGTGTSTVTVSDDTDYIFNQIKDILNKYNDLTSKVNAKLSEEKYPDYLPLTDDQREQLTDTQQQQWEDKAKSGLLKNDTMLSGLLTSMRKAMYMKVNDADPAFDTLADIGVTTGLWYENGKLYVDDNKLKNAIETDPNAVINLMQGVMGGLNTEINNGLDKIKQYAGDYLGVTLYDQSFMAKQISDTNDRILEMQDRLSNIEDRYYSQFTQMEQMISQMNAQSAWLSQQFQ